MSIQEQLETLLSSACGVGVFPIVAPQNEPYPYITYQRVISTNENVMDGNGNPPINQCRMQIDVWSKSYSQSQSLTDKVTSAMLGWSIQNIQLSSRDMYEAEVKIYRMSMDYSIWYR